MGEATGSVGTCAPWRSAGILPAWAGRGVRLTRDGGGRPLEARALVRRGGVGARASCLHGRGGVCQGGGRPLGARALVRRGVSCPHGRGGVCQGGGRPLGARALVRRGVSCPHGRGGVCQGGGRPLGARASCPHGRAGCAKAGGGHYPARMGWAGCAKAGGGHWERGHPARGYPARMGGAGCAKAGGGHWERGHPARMGGAGCAKAEGGHWERGHLCPWRPEATGSAGILPAWAGRGVPRRPVSRVLYPPAADSGHPSRPVVAGGLERPTRGRAGRPCPPIWPCSGWGLPGLRCYHQSGELLPRLFTLTRRGERYLSVALSVGSPRPAVNGHPVRWSSDFPLPRPRPEQRPPGHLG